MASEIRLRLSLGRIRKTTSSDCGRYSSSSGSERSRQSRRKRCSDLKNETRLLAITNVRIDGQLLNVLLGGCISLSFDPPFVFCTRSYFPLGGYSCSTLTAKNSSTA